MLDLLFTVAIALNPQPTRRTVVATTAAAALLPSRPALAAKSRTDPTYTFRRTPDEWKQQLSEMQYFVLREGGTESPNTSPLYVEKRAGTFRCAGCDSALFASNAKFNSGTGWPSFAKYIDTNVEVQDVGAAKLALFGAEVRCTSCGGHLGDVFLDGFLFPGTMAALTNRRYCIDGAALVFEPEGAPDVRVRGDAPPAKSPADVELPSWLQPPPIKAA